MLEEFAASADQADRRREHAMRELGAEIRPRRVHMLATGDQFAVMPVDVREAPKPVVFQLEEETLVTRSSFSNAYRYMCHKMIWNAIIPPLIKSPRRSVLRRSPSFFIHQGLWCFIGVLRLAEWGADSISLLETARDYGTCLANSFCRSASRHSAARSASRSSRSTPRNSSERIPSSLGFDSRNSRPNSVS